MALIKCKECEAEISNDAYNCPKCGASLKKRKRTIFGKIIKYAFIGFNILMLIWLIGGMSNAAGGISSLESDAEKAGAAVGTAIGAAMIFFIWISGAVILGILTLLTRPSK